MPNYRVTLERLVVTTYFVRGMPNELAAVQAARAEGLEAIVMSTSTRETGLPEAERWRGLSPSRRRS